MAIILHFPATAIRRSRPIVFEAPRAEPTPLWRRVLAWWLGPARPPDLPDELRDDVGLPREPRLYDRRITGYHPVDVTMLHGWRR